MKSSPAAGNIKKVALKNCPCSGKNLAKLVRPSVLAILSQGGPMHGYAITELLAQQHSLSSVPPSHPGVYRMLKQLEKDGMVTARLAESAQGPARKIYSITPRGRECMASWQRSLSEYRKAIDEFLKLLR